MRATVDVTVRTDHIERVRQQLPREADALVRATAFVVEGEAKRLAPVDTGFLRSSIRTDIVGAMAADVVVGASYGIYVELGTSRSGAQPFLAPAAVKGRQYLQKGWMALMARLTR